MIETAREIESLALHAWPARWIEPLDGWLLRRHTVPSRRVNAVWPNALGGTLSLAVRLQRTEAFYAGWGQPSRFQVSPAAMPADLDRALEARGYRVETPTAVQTAPAQRVAALAAEKQAPPVVRTGESLNRAWVEAYCSAQAAPISEVPARIEALALIEKPVSYVLVEVQGVPAAVGRGVADGPWLGVFGMATREGFRRRGLATAVLGALAAWALDNGIPNLYLQVMEQNAAARKLYAGLGFTTQYHYHYRSREIQGAQALP